MKRALASAVLMSALAATAQPAATPPPSGEVRVSVWMTGQDGQAAPASQAVVWLPGVGDPRVLRPSPPPSMASRNKRFEPRILAVPVGVPVAFPNLDRIYHNVFSSSEKNRFDLGLYRNGASRTTTFDTPGVVRVYCNIHPQMAAFVVIVDGSFYAVTGADGSARLAGVPAGRHPVRVWDEKGGDWSGLVEVPAGRVAELRVSVDASKWKDLPHKNKHGKDYPPPDDDDNRY